MTIIAADLKFFASARMDDTPTAGGAISSVQIQTGTENNAFPDIDTIARAVGRVQLRKIYATVLSADTDPLSAAHVIVSANPADPNVDTCIFAYGDSTTQRSAAIASIQSAPYALGAVSSLQGVSGEANKATALFGPAVNVGSRYESGLNGSYVLIDKQTTAPYYLTFNGPINPSLGAGNIDVRLVVNQPVNKCYGVALTTAASSSASVRINRTEARVVPNATPYPLSVDGIDPASFAYSQGKVPIFRPGDIVVIAGGGNSELAIVSIVDYSGGLTFSTALTNSYPTGSAVSSVLRIGDLQARVGPSFSQTTWTKAFSDSVIGSPTLATYNRASGVITATNAGAITQRWALVFGSDSTFKCYGETVGIVGAGNIGEAFAPNNPITNAPYFTLPAAGWGSGWSPGNVLQLATTGAFAPLWQVRCISPSSPAGVDGSTLTLRGTINA